MPVRITQSEFLCTCQTHNTVGSTYLDWTAKTCQKCGKVWLLKPRSGRTWWIKEQQNES